jgi:hypothetical protein
MCNYTGIYFLEVREDPKTLAVQLNLMEVTYKTDQFVNKLIEYEPNKFVCETWDHNKLIFIDHEANKLEKIIEHPGGQRTRCWGFLKLPEATMLQIPFLMSRDSSGFRLINTKTFRSFTLSSNEIKSNLSG